MLKKLTLTLILIGIGTFISRADNVEVDGIHYVTNPDDHTAYVTDYMFTGSSSGNSDFYVGDITIPSIITVDGEPYTVTSIGRYAFRNSNKLTSVTIPNTITTLGVACFEYCPALSEITIPESITTLTG